MSIETAMLTFALPEDTGADKLRIYQASSEDGTYTLATTFNYTYGYRVQEYDSIDTTKWYKIEFYNNTSGRRGPKSDPIFGGDFGTKDTPFLALSSTFDGANYTSASEIYSLTQLKASDISAVEVQKILRATRAYLDLRLNAVNLRRFGRFCNAGEARKKYNAALRITKEIELNLAAAVCFRSISNAEQMSVIRGETKSKRSFSVGSTSIQEGDSPSTVLTILNALSSRYAGYAASLMNSIMPNSVQVAYSDDYMAGPLFIRPVEAMGIIYNSTTIGSTFLQYTADLGANGTSMNSTEFLMRDNCVVEGESGKSVIPLEAKSALVDAALYINGAIYHLDSWIDHDGTTQIGKSGTSTGTTGFTLTFDEATTYAGIIWNNTTANGGFDLTIADEIVLKYWILG